MKFLVLLALLLSAIALALGEYEVNASGNVWGAVGQYRSLTPLEVEAMNNPGEEIPVDLRTDTFRRTDFFHDLAWHSILIVVAMALMALSNVLYKWRGALVAQAIALVATVVAGGAVIVAGGAVDGTVLAFYILTFFIAFCTTPTADEMGYKIIYFILSGIFYLAGIIALGIQYLR